MLVSFRVKKVYVQINKAKFAEGQKEKESIEG
jgi:hypothetical protein